MTAASSVRHCPDCGVTVRPNAQQCWLCSRVQVVSAPPVRHVPEGKAAAAPNPFAEETAVAQRYYYRTNVWVMLCHLSAILAVLPASGIAFVVTCTVAAESGQTTGGRLPAGEPNSVATFTALGAAIVVFVGFCMLIVSLGKKTVYRVEMK